MRRLIGIVLGAAVLLACLAYVGFMIMVCFERRVFELAGY